MFVFHLFYWNPKEIDHFRRKLNSKKNIFLCEISIIIIIILICQKLELVRSVQQKIKLPSPKGIGILKKLHKYVQEETMKNFFNSFLPSYIKYGNHTWGEAPKTKTELIIFINAINNKLKTTWAFACLTFSSKSAPCQV